MLLFCEYSFVVLQMVATSAEVATTKTNLTMEAVVGTEDAAVTEVGTIATTTRYNHGNQSCVFLRFLLLTFISRPQKFELCVVLYCTEAHFCVFLCKSDV